VYLRCHWSYKSTGNHLQVGKETLNLFCKEIMRKALTNAAFAGEADSSQTAELSTRTKSRADHWNSIFAGMLEVAQSQKTSTAKEIQIRRAVALMRLLEQPDDSVGLQELHSVATLAQRFYGPQAIEVQDIKRQLSSNSAW
jgi:hypothetical protein